MEADEYEYDGEAPRFWFSSRFGLAVLGFVGFLSMSSQRTCMKVAMVCMLNQTAITIVNERSAGGVVNSPPEKPPAAQVFPSRPDEYWAAGNDTGPGPAAAGGGGATGQSGAVGGDRWAWESGAGKVCVGVPEFFLLNTSEFSELWKNGEFVWSSSRENIVFDTFYWGFIVAHVPAGWLAQRFGGKRVFGGFLLAGSLSTALIPIASRTHFYLLLVLRFLGGVGSGGAFPAMHTLWGKWAPPLERSLLASITYAGSLTGSVFIYPVAGLLCKYGFDGRGFDGGWPSIFYIFGALGVLWFALWMVFASESPADHGRISDEERQYIEETLMSETATTLNDKSRLLIPWSKVLTSFPFAAIVLCNFTYEWGVYTIEKLFPEFMKTVLHLEMKWNDGFSLLPYFGLWFVVMASGGAADRLQSHGVLNTGTTRKVMQVIGTIIPAAMVAAMGFIDCSQWQGPISFITIGLSCCGFQYNGFLVNHLDIAPRYAGILMGIANAIGSTASFLGPYLHNVVKEVTEDEYERWQTMFLLTASFYLFSMFFFLLCGSGKLQDWAVIEAQVGPSDSASDQSPFSGGGDALDSASPKNNKTPLYVKELSTISSPSFGGGKIPDVFATDTLRRAAEEADARAIRALQSGSLPRANAVGQNHLAPSGQLQGDDDALNRKASNKSTNSSRSNESKRDSNPHRSDHERSRKRGRQHERAETERLRIDRDKERDREREKERERDRTASGRRTLKPELSRPAEESLEIYESLSESPV